MAASNAGLVSKNRDSDE